MRKGKKLKSRRDFLLANFPLKPCMRPEAIYEHGTWVECHETTRAMTMY
jgi:hypothetical protein